ncbi:Dam family site-specific DNA-(adenine-N6)-methyltransferase [[Clostridium] innocuum]|nr:Dam family site-specific DNA-(adenine-N6)-methyltransferase [[Clostridium] innocuum]
MDGIIKSPLNYIGNKHRILNQLQKYFPKEINTMVDLFCGGCDVAINMEANRIIANDINNYVVDIFKAFQNNTAEEILNYIDNTINQWGLSKTNKEAYLNFRNYYNSNKGNALDLYILMCFSFNYQFRFNANHDYNNPFGANRSSFNQVMRKNLINMLDRLDNITFLSKDFIDIDLSNLKKGDFVYADPPYLLTCGSYNDGKRGFKGWNQEDDLLLFDLLDKLDMMGVKFALSNVIRHKGMVNDYLLNWQEKNKYKLHMIDFNYNNCNYHTKNKENETIEVLITNY